MKKSKPITISEMDVQPISDEELQALTGTQANAAWQSNVCGCWDWYSDFYGCIDQS